MKPQCAGRSQRVPSSFRPTIGAMPFGKMAVSGSALPSASWDASTAKSCRIASLAIVLEYKLHMGPKIGGPLVDGITFRFCC